MDLDSRLEFYMRLVKNHGAAVAVAFLLGVIAAEREKKSGGAS